MIETFKSGQWRICSGCLASIAPRDRVAVIYDEPHCMACLTSHEEGAGGDGEWNDDIDTIITTQEDESA